MRTETIEKDPHLSARPDAADQESPENTVLDAGTFREAMSRVPGAVHVVTTTGPHGRAGFTATAVTAVSDHPPTILVCANAGSESAQALVENAIFCVNTLSWDDEPLAGLFAGRTELRGDDRFRQGRWTTLETGAPVLETALVSFDCRLLSAEIVGTHHVVIGEVRDVRVGRHARALVYRERAFHGV
ncbi:flavin reductase [Salinarimonas ramus]|uniref:FMN reductase n=1 Tax=Salinarimonas ramus TaxID=690164 RepID=A0A917V7T1_9HYPH|nr:flavin reductase [Salinarimonas ramus]GGK48353.1 FMN reductase [Salinarimonas ramus]